MAIALGMFLLRGYERFRQGSSIFGLDHTEWVGRTKPFDYQVFRGSFSDYVKHPGLGAGVTALAFGMQIANRWLGAPELSGYAVFAVMHWVLLGVGFGMLGVTVPERVGLRGLTRVLAVIALLGCGVWVVMAIPESFGIAAGLLAVTFSIVWKHPDRVPRWLGWAIVLNGACTLTNAFFPILAAACVWGKRRIPAAVFAEVRMERRARLWNGRSRVVLLGGLLCVMAVVAVGAALRGGIKDAVRRAVKPHLPYLNTRLTRDPAAAGEYSLWGLIGPAIVPRPYARRSGLSFEPMTWSEFAWIQYPGMGAWAVILSLGVWGIRQERFRPYVALLLGWIAFNLAFHNMWGDEFFMYSAHWAWALWVLFCIGLRSVPSRIVAPLCLLVVSAQAVGLWRLGVEAWRPQIMSQDLQAYERELNLLRDECGSVVELPKDEFFLFGMGNRKKYAFASGRLIDVSSNRIVRKWACRDIEICPPQYRVEFVTDNGHVVRIQEDENAVWLIDVGRHKEILADTESPVHLPNFEGCSYPLVLRVLHHEVLIGVTEAGPVPNPIVYDKPWYRDAAMMAMVLRETGNMHLIKDWILNLNEPYDMNNDNGEPDNLGQVLFLMSLVSDRRHPLVERVLTELGECTKVENERRFVAGKTDGGDHYVYQTKWAKFGLKSLGLPDPFTIPAMEDSYSALFWMEFKENHIQTRDASAPDRFPYLDWACAHFHGNNRAPMGTQTYPLTWEAKAGKACYSEMELIAPGYAAKRIAGPHAWHAAEVMLYLLAKEASLRQKKGGG